MIRITLAEAAAQIGASLSFPNQEQTFSGISIDTRTIQAEQLYVAILGEKLDGHDFVTEAAQKGAAAALVSRPVPADIPQLIVKDTTKAMGQLAANWRNRFTLPIIGATGSNGKTTLKNMIAAILVAACDQDHTKVLATRGNFNNYWGLPLMLANLNEHHRYAVLEMGMNHPGEIAYLTQLTRPQVAVITNAASAHLEGLGDIAGVARAKAEIFQGLPKDGVAILNRDDGFYTFWREQIGELEFLSFGLHPDSDIRGQLEHNSQNLSISTPQGDIHVTLPLLGQHNLLNALAAAATTFAADISLAAIKEGLENVKPAPGRLQLHTLTNGVKIIDDTYNANPVSLTAAVNTLASFMGKKILVLGDMKELGSTAEMLHQTAGEEIRKAGIDYLFTFGELSANTASSFGEGAYHFNEQTKLLEALKPFLYNQTTILVKGSRSMHMEKVVASLMT